MKLTFDEILDDFYSQLGEEYKKIPKKEIANIVRSPFLMLRKNMEDGTLPVIRFQWFGTFILYPKRVKGMFNHFKQKFEKGLIEESYFRKKESQLNKILKRYENED